MIHGIALCLWRKTSCEAFCIRSTLYGGFVWMAGGLLLERFLGQGNLEDASACVLKGEGICWCFLVLLVAQGREPGLALKLSVPVVVAVVVDQLWCCDVL